MGKLHKCKCCPKCGGTLYLDRDFYGWYEQCLQCAYLRDVVEVSAVQELRKESKAVNHILPQ
jgi:hypothetical protein